MRGVKIMKKYNIGFIGSGKMAGAIIKGLLSKEVVKPNQLLATQSSGNGIKEKSEKLGINVIVDNKFLAEKSDIIFLATKPNQVFHVLEEIKPYLNEEKLIVSIAAGITTQKIENYLSQKNRVIRVMPNTPAVYGEGMSGILQGKYATKEDIENIQELMSTMGKTIIVDNEEQMNIVTAISGSGPAFFYKIINDIALAGEKLGLEYEKSLLLSIQTAIGSAKMALNRDKKMEDLIASVATKGGCTEVGIKTMQELGFEEKLYSVIEKTTKKAKELGE